MSQIGFQAETSLEFPGLANGEERAVLPLADENNRFIKIRSGRAYSRFYYLDRDLQHLKYKGSKKIQCIQGHINSLDVHDICEVNNSCESGEVTRIARSHGYTDDHCLCLVLDNASGKCLDLVAESRDVRDKWIFGLRILLHNERRRCHWQMTKAKFENFDTNKDGLITFEDTLTLLKQHGRGLNKLYAKDLFNSDAVDTTLMKDGSKELTLKQYMTFMISLAQREEVVEIFEKLAEKKQAINPLKLKQFMEIEQREFPTTEDCMNIIHDCDVCPNNNMCILGFANFMESEKSLIFKSAHRKVYQNMNQPLNHYHIATSHNTYLLKDQLKGPSSVDAYIQALRRGCRCVELDCWDGPNNEPIIFHGYTLTSKILFKDVIQGINDHAFDTSQFPVILSFENHCSVEQQKVMAHHLKSILGDKLYTTPVAKDMTRLPSPEALKGKILVKGKKLPSDTEVELSDDEDEDYSAVKAALDDIGQTEINGNRNSEISRNSIESTNNANNAMTKTSSFSDMNGTKEVNDNGTEGDNVSDNSGGDETEISAEHESGNSSKRKKKMSSVAMQKVKQVLSNTRSISRDDTKNEKEKSRRKKKVAKEMSDLVVLCQSVSFHGFKHCKENYKFCEMCSFEEKKALKLIKNEPGAFVQYNQRHLSRIYPAGHRVDSSNYSPETLWNVGCQMVALNYQTGGKAMELNQGKFQENGGCGYVLKPQFMRNDNCTFDPRMCGEEFQTSNMTMVLKIKIISGFQLPRVDGSKQERDLCIGVKICGVDADCQKTRTRNVRNSGYNPIWNESIEFKVYCPDLALVQISVKEVESGRTSSKNGTQLGQFTLPFNSIAQGYRHVQLYTKSWEMIDNAVVFAHVDITQDSSKKE